MTTLTKKLIACVCAAAAAVTIAALPSSADDNGIALYDILEDFGHVTGSIDYRNDYEYEKIDKTSYVEGEGFDPKGLSIINYYYREYWGENNGWRITYDTADGTDFSFVRILEDGTETPLSPGDALHEGDKVKIKYGVYTDYSGTFAVERCKFEYELPISVTSKPTTPPTNESTEPVTPPYIPSYIPSSSPSPEEKEPKFGDKSGWDSVSDEIKNKENGEISIDMNGTTNVPKNIFSDIAGKDIDLVLDMGDGIVWKINGQDVTEPKDISFGVKKDENIIPVEVINNVTGAKETIRISLEYDGDLGLAATMIISLGSGNDGYYANLFYYNPETKVLELTDFCKIENGKANLTFTHASDWAIVIDKEPLSADASTEAGIIDEENSIDGQSSGSIFVFPAIAAVLGALAAFSKIKAKK